METQHVLIVEKDEALSRGIEKALNAQGLSVFFSTSASQAFGMAQRGGVVLIILGEDETNSETTELCGYFSESSRTKDIPIVVISSKGAEANRVEAFLRGAADFVPKPLSLRELALRVRAIIRRHKTPPAEQRICVGEVDIFPEQHLVRVKGQPIQLTRQEMRLLVTMAKQRDRVFTRSELLDLVWSGDSEVMERTVDAHVKGLRAKLGSAAAQLETVHGVGYRLSEPPRSGEKIQAMC